MFRVEVDVSLEDKLDVGQRTVGRSAVGRHVSFKNLSDPSLAIFLKDNDMQFKP